MLREVVRQWAHRHRETLDLQILPYQLDAGYCNFVKSDLCSYLVQRGGPGAAYGELDSNN